MTTMNGLTRRQALLGGAALGGTVAVAQAHAQTGKFTAPQALMDAARKEGRMVLYTSNFTEVMLKTIATFNKNFPFVRVELVRAPGGQLFTRIRTEAAAGKLTADTVMHSDRGLMLEIENVFADYAPPNADAYRPDCIVSPKLWPAIAPCWSIAYHTELVKNPPKNWMDLTKAEYGNGQIGQVVGPSGGTTWTRAMFERQVLGEDYWAKQAATKPRLYPSGAPLSDALVRGEVAIAPLLYNIIFEKKRDGAPVEIFFPPEGVPMTPYGCGITRTAANPNAARLFMDWCLSLEGQVHMIVDQGNVSAMKTQPAALAGFDPARHKLWMPDFKQFQELFKPWLDEWNRAYNYRQ